MQDVFTSRAEKRRYLADSDREQDRQAYAIDEIASPLNEILNLKLLPPELNFGIPEEIIRENHEEISYLHNLQN
jgi:hypothetical protein